MMPSVWQRQEDRRVGSLPRGSSGESSLGEEMSVQFGMRWLWSICKTTGRRHSVGSLYVGLDAEAVWRERELEVVSSYTVAVLGQCDFREAKWESVCSGEGMGGGQQCPMLLRSQVKGRLKVDRWR